jgi:hypothetical protein
MTGHVSFKGNQKILMKFWFKNVKGRDHLGNPGVQRRLILRCILTAQGSPYVMEFVSLVERTCNGNTTN